MRRRHKSTFDYYAELGLKSTATRDEIKSAYRRLAVQYHPDKNPNDAEAEIKFKRIVEAYAALIDADVKKQYDEHEHPLVAVKESRDTKDVRPSPFVDWIATPADESQQADNKQPFPFRKYSK